MKYEIYAGSTKIYDSSDKLSYPIISPSVDLGMNDAGSMEFTVLPGHLSYNNLTKMKTFLTTYKDDREIFYGRILNSEKGIDDQMTVHGEGAYVFFLDSEMGKGKYTETIPEFITRCINAHNSQVEVEKQFTVGEMTADKAVEIDSKTGQVIKIDFEIQDYSQTKNVLDSLVLQKYGGFFRVRPNPNGPHFLDYVQNYGRINTQTIKIAENVIDKTDNVSGENIFTILRPLGKNNLTIESCDPSEITLPNVVKSGGTLRLTDKIEDYGSIIRIERFGDIDKADQLLKAAEDFIQRRGTQLPASCEIGYVDWNMFNPNVMDVRLGDQFTTIEGFAGVTMTVANQHLDMEDAANDTMTLQNPEELAENDPNSSSGSLSASYASKCTHIDYIYKYIHEGENQIIIATEGLTQLSGILTSITGGQVYIVADEIEIDDPDHPGQKKKTTGDVKLVARRVDPDHPDGVVTELDVNFGNVAITNANLTVDGYVEATEFNALKASFQNLTTGNEAAGFIRANNAAIGALSVNGHSHNNSNITIDGVTYNIVTWS